ncbi:unnamed protein product [Adineta steineri]|uniref:Cadherin domain-containing protein n=1 Tax=Adineta steineri TaxID=433720 RepID=A0A814ZND0_9BILA|nr:unnamed protein product [Adineta steineri]CAF1530154.1 unnamed protein product [Adineta steineri]
MIFLFFFILPFVSSQTIKQLNEISINEELPIGSIITFLTDKIPNLDQSLEYDLVTPVSSELDLFSIDHTRQSLIIKKRIDYEQICTKTNSTHCIIPISIAVSNHDTIYVYILPIRIKNINDNPIKFSVNRTVIEIEENDKNWYKKSYLLPQATDADGDLITYSLYLQNWNKPTGLFELDQTNFSLKPLKSFDREQQNLYLLRLIAQNKHDKDVSIDIIIIIKDVNDNSPICEHNPTIFIINNTNSISILSLNVTDLDEGDNGKLEYSIINPLSGFTIDRLTGEIKFDYKNWLRENNQTKLFINVTDDGKPYRLSTECIIELKFLFAFDIHFETNYTDDSLINIENIHLPIGKFLIIDKQTKMNCFDCLIDLNSSLDDIFYLNDKTFELYLNYNSMLLIRILSNYMIKQENLLININLNVFDKNNPSIISTKNYSLILSFNKMKLLINSNILFIKIDQNIFLNEQISIFNRYHYCLNNHSKQFIINDPTNTFEIDNKYNLIVKKYLNIKQQQNYEIILKEIENNQTEEINSCSIQLRIHVYDLYSVANVYPYFTQSFYILSSTNISQFSLPSLPSYVKYISSKSNEISIDEINGSIAIQSPSLFSSYSYDFYIQAINSQTPSLSCSIPIRIFFGINRQSPRLVQNLTKQSIEIPSLTSDFIYQIQAYDPDLSLDNQYKLFPPSIQYEVDSSENLDIERYTGRIFRKNSNQFIYNFTLILMDFGQPDRLITRVQITFHIKSNELLNRQEIPMFISTTFILISSAILVMIVLLIIIILLLNCCHRQSSTNKSLANISPTTPDSRLIDNEYITTTTSLPRVVNREQRIYPTITNDNERKLLEQIHLPPPPLYSAEKVFIKQDYQQNLSMNDINKYLERFEKIYNNSSESNGQEPIGLVV